VPMKSLADRRWRLAALPLCLQLASFPIHAAGEPQYRFRVLGPEQGLQQPLVTGVTQDQQGFLWLAGLGQGLLRYDGHEVVAFRHEPENDNSLDHSLVKDVAVDSQGRIWITTEAGLNSLDPQSMRFTRWTTGAEDLNHLLIDQEDNVWVGTVASGVYRLDPRTAAVTRVEVGLPVTPGMSAGTNKLYQEPGGRIWIGLASGLVAFDPGREQPVLTYVHDPEDEGTLPAPAVAAVLRDDRGALWVGTGNGLAVMEPGATKFHRLPSPPLAQRQPDQLQDNVATVLHQDRRGELWVGTPRGGLHRLIDREAYRFQVFQPDPADPYSLGGVYVWDVLEDDEGVLHFAAGGLSTLDPDTTQFLSWAAEEPESQSRRAATASSGGLALAAGRIWLGGGHGLHGLDPLSGTWETHRLHETDEFHPRNRVQSLAPSSGGGLWVGLVNGLAHFHPATGFTQVTELESTAVSIRETRDGSVWASAVFSGLVQYKPETGEVFYHRPRAGEPEALSHTAVWAIEEDVKGELWLGTQRGLNVLSRASGKFRLVEPGPERTAWPSDEFRALHFSEGSLWVATAGGGVLRLDPASGAIQDQWTIADGLRSDLVYAIQDDQHGGLWLSTSSGLARLDAATRAVRIFTVADGLLTDRISSAVLDERGWLWLRTDGGLVSLDLARLSPPARTPRIVSTELLIDGKPLEWSATGPVPISEPQLARVDLDHRQRVLRFKFSALDYVNPGRVLYQHRLAGIDPDWNILAPGERSIIYTTLPTGTHALEIRARNRDGVWSEADHQLAIHVAAPPWLTWQAYLAYALASMLALALVVAWRTHEARRRAQSLELEVQKRTLEVEEQRSVIERQAGALARELDSKNRLFADVSHEFRTPLTLIRGPLAECQAQAIPEATRNRLKVASRATARLERLVDQLLDLARLDAGEPPPQDPQPLGAEIGSQVQAFRQLADERQIELGLGRVESVWVRCGADPLEKIVSNLLSNAVKFCRPGDRVTVTVVAEEGFGVLRVEDTGPGMNAELLARVFDRFQRGVSMGERIPGAGIGLALARRLAEACGGQITIESAPDEGTCVTVRLPRVEAGEQGRPDVPTENVMREIQAAGAGAAIPALESEIGERLIGAGAAHVLVVEDNEELAAYIRQILAEHYLVEAIHDGEHALERARSTVPDLVVCDAMLPGIDGFDVCERLKGDALTSHVPVLMLTARADRDSRREAYRRHADDFLTKPFDRGELLQRIENLLEIRKLLRESFGRKVFVQPGALEELDSPDRRFLDRLTHLIEKRYADPALGITEMAAAVAMSERQLQRKLKALTNSSPMEYLRLYRLERGRERLAAGDPVGRVAMDVGFTSASYFGKWYRARYGAPPREARTGADEPEDS
jgi:signal transduction histidine kinase/ligand-binding sensor domain-containing protein/DNA-binding response OmpR family regulator